MPHHHHASEGSQRCCDQLLSCLRSVLPDVDRAQSKDTCGLYVPSRNRFAYIYHRSAEPIIRVYFRGDPSADFLLEQPALEIKRRDRVDKGWDKEFPYYAAISTDHSCFSLAALLISTAFPLSVRRGKPHDFAESGKDPFIEGARKLLTRVGYTRALAARIQCIAHYGASCQICEFDFWKAYGEIGCGFIHVHHLVAISEFDVEHVVDPIHDLLPVCPNCHAMLHHKRNPTPAQLRQLIKRSLT